MYFVGVLIRDVNVLKVGVEPGGDEFLKPPPAMAPCSHLNGSGSVAKIKHQSYCC